VSAFKKEGFWETGVRVRPARDEEAPRSGEAASRGCGREADHVAWQLVWHGSFLATTAGAVGERADAVPGPDATGAGAGLLDRFPDALAETLERVGVERRFITAELAEMKEGQWAKTANRSVIGIMNAVQLSCQRITTRPECRTD
jgi:hypothetical protein